MRMRRLNPVALLALAAVVAIVVACGERAAAGSTTIPADAVPSTVTSAARDWPTIGGDAGSAHYSGLGQITKENVTQLAVAWSMRTGDASHDSGMKAPKGESCSACHTGSAKFEATPILANNRLYLSTPLNRVLALDPASGKELWRHDPKLDMKQERSEGFVSRGVAFWQGAVIPSGRPERSEGGAREAGSASCIKRVFFGTVDARLLALDADSGTLCSGFGENGTVRLDQGIGPLQVGQYGMTSPPMVVGDVVVTGSSIGDNRRVEMERGIVRGWDAVSGKQVWSFDPMSEDQRTGGGNAWAPLSADLGLGLVFIPTGSAAPDFFGGQRPGNNQYTNAVVALKAATGEVVWSFQTVHHDLWDFDVSSPPALITVPKDGVNVPAVAVSTKHGFIFILDRRTGKPLFPVEERPVPASDIPGEVASATQPFPVLPKPLFPSHLTREMVWGFNDEERDACLAQFDKMKTGPIFTPPSTQGTVMFPAYSGGTTWGGVSWSPEENVLVLNLMRLPFWVKLRMRQAGEKINQEGTPWIMSRAMLSSPKGLPCSKPPWGNLVAIDLRTGEEKWQVPLGTVPKLSKVPGYEAFGSPSMGGSIITSSGIVFIAAAMDDVIRGFDLQTGKELWKAALPAGGQATPMTYEWNGKQYLVISAGGHGNLGTTAGDYVVAFALQ